MPELPNIVTLIKAEFDVDLTKERDVRALRTKSFDAWHDFALRYKAEADGFRPPPPGKSPDPLTPYVDEYLVYPGFPSLSRCPIPDHGPAYLEAVKRLVLFNNQVYVQDTYIALLDFLRFPAGETEKRVAHLGRVLDATELLAQMAELIDEQIVHFVPSEARPGLTPVGGWIPEGHWREWEAAWESLGNELPDSDPKIDHIHSCGVLGISPLFPSHNVEQQTMRALEIMSNLGEQIPRLRYQPVYATIARIPLPKIENLRWGDLVKIRKNDEAFAAFRTGTTRLLRQFENSVPSSIGGMAHFVADADGELKTLNNMFEPF